MLLMNERAPCVHSEDEADLPIPLRRAAPAAPPRLAGGSSRYRRDGPRRRALAWLASPGFLLACRRRRDAVRPERAAISCPWCGAKVFGPRSTGDAPETSARSLVRSHGFFVLAEALEERQAACLRRRRMIGSAA